MGKKQNNGITDIPANYKVRRKRAETLASIGMLMIAGGLMIPLFDLFNTNVVQICKWIFAAGSLVFLAARCIKVSPDNEEIRLKRMRRMEFWSGACFAVAAFLWFYNEQRYSNEFLFGVGTLTVMRDTIVFSIAGAALQIVASWLIYYREKKLEKSGR